MKLATGIEVLVNANHILCNKNAIKTTWFSGGGGGGGAHMTYIWQNLLLNLLNVYPVSQ